MLVIAISPVFPGQLLGFAVFSYDQLVFGVDGIGSAGEGELKQLGFCDRLGGAGFHAEVAVDASEIVDFVDVAEAFAGRDGILRRIVGAAHINAVGRADSRAKLAADAFLHAVFVAVEHMASVKPWRLVPLFSGIRSGDPLLEEFAESHGEPA